MGADNIKICVRLVTELRIDTTEMNTSNFNTVADRNEKLRI